MDVPPQRSSLVDETESSLRAWLAGGTHRPGDRLPPELELAAMLGVSRGRVSRQLSERQAGKRIEQKRGRLSIRDRAALQRVVAGDA